MDVAGPLGSASAEAPLEHIDFSLPSTIDTVTTLEEAAEKMALRAGFDPDGASNIAMATREAVINAAKHGNGYDSEKQVKAAIERSAQAVTVRITDAGQGVDPDTLPDPLDPANLLRDSGRGIFLMRAIMDEVHFRQTNPGTEVTLIKHRDMEAGT